MIATFKPCRLCGAIEAPPSKSMAHRYLIGAALSGRTCRLTGVDYSGAVHVTYDTLPGTFMVIGAIYLVPYSE